MERSKDAPAHIIKIITDLVNLSDHKVEDWRWRYHRGISDYEMTEEKLVEIVPLDRESYDKRFKKKDVDLDKLKTAAGVKVTTKAPDDEVMEALRMAAGIRR
jgi:hypothetical protein